MIKNIQNKIMISMLVAATMALTSINNVFAEECKTISQTQYGSTERCTVNKRFEIDKKVKIEGGGRDWEDKVTGAEKDDVVIFRIKIKNRSDEKAGSFDDMKMKDFLPAEMERVGGDGLTEYWEDFDPGETKTFEIKAKIDSDEFDREKFEKCIVNKAEVRWDDKFEGADTATVCYGNADVKELPETGFVSGLTITGAFLMIVGAFIKKAKLA